MLQAIYLMGVTLLIPIHLSELVAVVIIMTLGALLHHFGMSMETDTVGYQLGSIGTLFSTASFHPVKVKVRIVLVVLFNFSEHVLHHCRFSYKA